MPYWQLAPSLSSRPAIPLVARIAIILTHQRDLSLEGFQVFCRFGCRLGIGHQLRESGIEIRLVFPDRRQGFGLAFLGIVGEKRGLLLASFNETRKNLLRLIEIEWSLPLDHFRRDLALLAVLLHQVLAGFDGISLRH